MKINYTLAGALVGLGKNFFNSKQTQPELAPN